MKDHGCEVVNPALDDDDFDVAVQTAQDVYRNSAPDVIAGSSRGGAVAMNIQSAETPLVLLCPAWKNWGTASTVKANTVILHSHQDDVIPFQDSERLIARSQLPREALIAVGSDHRLADPESLSVMTWACEWLVSDEGPSCLDDGGRPVSGLRHTRRSDSHSESSYVCDACGEEIVVPVDVTEGTTQDYVEDCPVCCRPNRLHVLMDGDGNVHIRAEPEQDYD